MSYTQTAIIPGARAVLEQALSAAQGLETLSQRGRIVPEINNPSVREIFVFRYRLLYFQPTEILFWVSPVLWQLLQGVGER